MKIYAVLISLLFVALAGMHIFWDAVTIDAIAIVLIVLASLPWVFPYLKTLELPGGVKIELKDVKSAVEQVSSGTGTSSSGSDAYEYLQVVSSHDPNLALVAIRIEIEKAVRATLGDSTRPIPLSRAMSQLVADGVISKRTASGIQDFIKLGNQAAHGVTVDRDAADFAIENAANLLIPFKEQIAKAA